MRAVILLVTVAFASPAIGAPLSVCMQNLSSQAATMKAVADGKAMPAITVAAGTFDCLRWQEKPNELDVRVSVQRRRVLTTHSNGLCFYDDWGQLRGDVAVLYLEEADGEPGPIVCVAGESAPLAIE